MCLIARARCICSADQTGRIFSLANGTLGITDFKPERVGKYVFESKREKELVYVHRTTYDGPVTPSAEELDGGRFWTIDEIREAIGKEVLTPNFESEFTRFFL